VPAALAYLDRAETRFRALRSQLWSVLTDRAELLLSVRLSTEARAAAEEAVAACERERRRLVLPEARLLLAQAAFLDGDLPAAERQAALARRDFTGHGKPDWAALAQLTVLRCRLAGGSGPRPGVPLLERIAGALAPSWPDQALEAWLAAARSIHKGRKGERDRLLGLAGAHRRHGVATLRARAWYAEALRHVPADPARALRAARAGLRILDEHVAGLGATDLRAHAAGHRVELVQLGLGMAVRDGRAAEVLAWAERGRASHLLLRPVRPPDDPVLERALGELRATVAEIDQLRGSGRVPPRLVQRQVTLERKVRDYGRERAAAAPPGAVAGDSATGEVPADALLQSLGDATLLEFVDVDGTLHVVTAVAGRLRLRRLAPVTVIHDLVDRLPFALRRLARGYADRRSRSAALTLLLAAARRLDEALLGPIRADLGDRPLVIVPTGPLQSLPWFVLPSCADRPVTVSPSAALWHAAGRGTVPAGPTAVAGYGPPGAAVEAREVARIHGAVPLIDAAATVGSVMDALDGAALAHLAAHGRLQPDNPLFSSLRFADGPLTIYDLERLHRMPAMVVLASCDSARTVDRAGDELLGISATFLSRGTRQVVASVIPVPDAATIPLMVEFHRRLAGGVPAPEALVRAQLEATANGVVSMAAAAGFVCVGASSVRPGPVREHSRMYAAVS